ncbi:MAG: gamma-glutamylcyclotransferase [Rhodocyclaceae bacterium]|nr:gamma-glutamylcyclotransferase [Rhodocyclaceae bacterium]
MRADRFITFAYGSNMPTVRLRERCPSAMPLGVAQLNGYELCWHKKSKDGSGKCDIVPSASPEAYVLGVLYEIADAEKVALDKAEGLGHGYKEIEIQVLCNGKQMTAKAYQASEIDHALTPYSWYRALVLAGAKEHHLPNDYIARLAAVSAQVDPDRERHKKYMYLIGEVEV